MRSTSAARSIGALLGCAVLLAGCHREPPPVKVADSSAYRRFLVEFRARHPAAGVQDLYKLIHQSVFGVGHLIEDADSARGWLEREIDGLGPAPPDVPDPEPLLEPLDPTGRLVRVNLRPWVARGLDVDALHRAVLETARAVDGDPRAFVARWNELRALVADRRIDLLLAEVDALAREARRRGYPAMHHTEPYRRAYAPAYRVVLADRLSP